MTASSLFTFLIAILTGMLVGIGVHYASRLLGLAETVPGVIVSTAVSTFGASRIRWKLD